VRFADDGDKDDGFLFRDDELVCCSCRSWLSAFDRRESEDNDFGSRLSRCRRGLALFSMLVPANNRSSSISNECNDDGGIAANGVGLLVMLVFCFCRKESLFSLPSVVILMC
jgi:hypothetical protein